jgi:hypothetical protein
MTRADMQVWADAYDKEYHGFKELNASKIDRPEPGVEIHDTLTRLEHIEDKGTFFK